MPNLYALKGTGDCPQVEPQAGYWPRCPVLRTVTLKEALSKLPSGLRPHPAPGSSQEAAEITELRALAAPAARTRRFAANDLSQFLTDARYFERPPVGAILRHASAPVIRNGLELATLFEAETPGLWHRHVLSVFMDPVPDQGFCQSLTPPRQALIWSALDLAISSALAIAWDVKWIEQQGTIGWRQRPQETYRDLDVLFDYVVTFKGSDLVRTKKKTDRKDFDFPELPGTPLHPAYTSGHSTYSAAASEVLGCLFPGYKNEFDKLANDIGMARLWGGVHWRSDHEFGLELGRAVGLCIIDQLNASGISRLAKPEVDPPADYNALVATAEAFGNACGSGSENFCGGVLPDTATKFLSTSVLRAPNYSTVVIEEEAESTVRDVGVDDALELSERPKTD